MRRLAQFAALPLLALAITGCTSQQNYDKLMTTNRTLQEQVVRLEEERDTARANLESVRSRLAGAEHDLDGLKGRSGGLISETDALRQQYEDMMRRVAELQLGPLPEDLATALQELASEHSELLTFDTRTGMLRFASDFTFALGSTSLNSEASSTLSHLAGILNSGKASGFEVRVIGHTDNVPVEKAETRQKHPTNVHLSAHRAIAVRDALVSAGVDANRFQVAGYGEFRPIVPNGPKGAAENRRVEIYLLPMPTLTISTTPAAPARSTATQPTIDEPMK